MMRLSTDGNGGTVITHELPPGKLLGRIAGILGGGAIVTVIVTALSVTFAYGNRIGKVDTRLEALEKGYLGCHESMGEIKEDVDFIRGYLEAMKIPAIGGNDVKLEPTEERPNTVVVQQPLQGPRASVH